MSNAANVDFTLYDHGSISVLVPRTDDAKDWVAEFLPDDAQWIAGGVVIEARYVADIVDGITADGYTFG